jgi:hypothetical protein
MPKSKQAVEEKKPVDYNWVKAYPKPQTQEELEETLKNFGPYCQIAYKAVVLHHLFGIDWEKAKYEARMFGEDSDEQFFEHINNLNAIMGLKTQEQS